MHSKIESLKNNIEAGLLAGVLPVPVFSLRGFSDMLQLTFVSGDGVGFGSENFSGIVLG